MRKKRKTQKSRREGTAKLAAAFIGAALGLLFYCGSFYVKAYMQNCAERQSYDKLREVCLSREFTGMDDMRGTDDDSAAEDLAVKDSAADEVISDETDDDSSESPTAPAFPESFGISWESLYRLNQDITAWILVPGADISYPVVRGEDDEFYLSHSVTGEEDPFGTIFLGSRNSPDFQDSHSFLYGHNMEGNMMFANLNRYEERNFWEECPEFLIYTPEKMYRYRIFSIEQAEEQSPAFRYGYRLGSEAYKTQLNLLAENSMYQTKIAPDCNKSMVTLVTCNSRLDEHVRMTIHGICCETIKWDDILEEK